MFYAMSKQPEVVSAGDGKKPAELKLDALPVFDGMIAAGGRTFCATTDGRVVALAGGR
jgi:hypothetical protein